MLSLVVPRNTTGEWICRRLMAWLRELRLESVDIIVKSDNEPALTSLIASLSTMRAMTSGSRMIIENRPVGSSKSNGIVERAIQSVQEMIRTIGSDIEGRWEVKMDATHSIWPWIPEHAARFEVGRYGKTANKRLKGKSATVQGMAFAEGILWKRKTSGWAAREADVHVGGWHLLGCQSDNGGGHRGESKWRVADENCSEKTRQGEMGAKQFGIGFGGPMGQK